MTDVLQWIENQESQALPMSGYDEKRSVDVVYLSQVICEQRRKIEDAERENKVLKEEKTLLISSWKNLKSCYSDDKSKNFLLLYENLREEKNTNGCDIERHDKHGYDRRIKRLKNELSEMKSLCRQKDARIHAHEQQINVLKKDVNLAFHSLVIERTQSENSIKRLEEQLRRSGEEKDRVQQLLLEQQSDFDEMKQFSRSLEEQLRQNEKEKEKAQKLLQQQQREMGEIKQIAKSSFMKVAKSNTIDDPETERKRIARASEQYETLKRQRVRNKTNEDWYRGNETGKDSVTSNSDSSSSVDSSLKSNNRIDEIPSGLTIDRRKKNATTVITAKTVNINHS